MPKATILIVEDEAIVAEDLSQKLGRLGYEVSGITARGEEAVAFVRDRRPDLVLMDIRLQGRMDGVEAAELIRREGDLPVIYLTAHSDRATLQRAKLTEPFGYILKPFEELELETHIEMALYKHQTDRKLRQSETLLRSITDNSPDPIFLKDRASRMLLANPATLAALQKRAEDVLGKTDEEFYDDPAMGRFMMANDRRVMESGKTEVMEEVVPSPSGPRIFLSAKTPYRDAEGHVIGIIGIARDITERKRAEAELQRRNAALRASNKQLEFFNTTMVDRELRMVELKKEVDALCVQFGQPTRYGYA